MYAILQQAIPAYGGRIVQCYGDGILSIFRSSSEGVRCAIHVQRALQKGTTVPVRIGLHSGEVCSDAYGIYGDCVNIASRIESLSSPGAVLISDKVFDEVKNQSDIKASSIGQFNLKNVYRLVEVFAIANHGLLIPERNRISATTPCIHLPISTVSRSKAYRFHNS